MRANTKLSQALTVARLDTEPNSPVNGDFSFIESVDNQIGALREQL